MSSGGTWKNKINNSEQEALGPWLRRALDTLQEEGEMNIKEIFGKPVLVQKDFLENVGHDLGLEFRRKPKLA